MRLYAETFPTYQTTTAQQRRYNNTSCNATGSSSIVGTNDQTVGFEWRWKEGWSIANVSRRRNRGEILPITPWKQYSWKSVGESRTRSYCNTSGQHFAWENYLTGTSIWLDPDFVTLNSFIEDELDLQYFVQQAAARIASGGWDALTFLAELSNLRKQFANLAKLLWSKVSVDEALKLGRDSHNLWLEARYGWRTLMYDIHDLKSAIDELNDRRSRYSEKAGLSHSIVVTDSFYGGGNPQDLFDLQTEIKLSQRGTVIADINVPNFQFNPVTTAWEVTRLSFVVDWLVNVGQALDAATFSVLCKDYSAAGGYRADFSGTCQVSNGLNPSGYTNYAANGFSSWSGYIEQRIPMSVSVIPRLKLRLDAFKAIDLLALIVQRVRWYHIPRARRAITGLTLEEFL